MKTTKPAVKKTPVKKAAAAKPAEMTVVTELPKDAKVLNSKPPVPAPAAELTIQDIAHFKQILEVVSARGAFKPDEMTLVGETYNKLTAFLDTAKNGQE
jgi:hypothetical protein